MNGSLFSVNVILLRGACRYAGTGEWFLSVKEMIIIRFWIKFRRGFFLLRLDLLTEAYKLLFEREIEFWETETSKRLTF